MDMWRAFADFCRLDQRSGGPDSHMTTMAEIVRGKPALERAWAMLVYVSVYNVPMALAILKEFPTRETPGLRVWIAEHWLHIVLRRERKRPVGSPTKLADCLESCATWVELERLANANSYEALWADIDRIRYFGRYAKLKALEALHRVGAVQHTIPDLRAHGAESPRQGLALLWPAHEEILNRGGNHRDALCAVELLADQTLKRLANDYQVELNRYCLQTLVCDFKQVVVTQRQYPGRSVDSELSYYTKIADYFTLDDTMFRARRELFPKWALGEVQGWLGVREELGEFFVNYGHMWSDEQFDYLKTTDLSNPVARL